MYSEFGYLPSNGITSYDKVRSMLQISDEFREGIYTGFDTLDDESDASGRLPALYMFEPLMKLVRV